MKIALLVYNNSRCYRSVNSHLVVSTHCHLIIYLLAFIYYYLSITTYLLPFIYYIVSIIIYYHLPIDIERKGCLVCR